MTWATDATRTTKDARNRGLMRARSTTPPHPDTWVLWEGSCGAVYMYSFYRLNCLVMASEVDPIPEMDPEGLVIRAELSDE
jgi:hypothetical protein